MKAIVYQGPQQAAVVGDRAGPQLRDEFLLVKVIAVALNPTDWKHVEYGLTVPGSILGLDYAGVVQEVGSKVTKDFKIGDRVCGLAHGGNQNNLNDGAFAEYIVVKGDIQMKIPENMSFEEGATLGCSVGSAGQGLYDNVGLGLTPPSQPTEHSETVLIYGGTSATGIMGIQFAKA